MALTAPEMSPYIAACLAVLLQAPTGTATAAENRHDPWTAHCHSARSIHDGDTFTCVPAPDQREPFVVRLAGADAPELGQPYARAARDQLAKQLASGATVACYKRDRYAREVCRVTDAAGQDIALALVEQGLAWHAVRYVREQEPGEAARYRKVEAVARDGKKGLWAAPDAMAPWDCRKARLNRQRCR